MSKDLDWIERANARAKGKRPNYFDDPDKENMLSMIVALLAEMSVMRERLDTVERLLEQKDTISREDIETFSPDEQASYERGMLNKELIARVMRGPTQAMDALAVAEPSVEQISEELGETD